MKCPVLLVSYFIRLVITRAGESGGAVIAMSPSPPFSCSPSTPIYHGADRHSLLTPIDVHTHLSLHPTIIVPSVITPTRWHQYAAHVADIMRYHAAHIAEIMLPAVVHRLRV